MDDHTHLRINALQRRIEYLEEHLKRVHEHAGLGPLPGRPEPTEDEIAPVRQLLADGKEQEALQLHRDLTGQGTEESWDVLQSMRAGL